MIRSDVLAQGKDAEILTSQVKAAIHDEIFEEPAPENIAAMEVRNRLLRQQPPNDGDKRCEFRQLDAERTALLLQ